MSMFDNWDLKTDVNRYDVPGYRRLGEAVFTR